MFGRIRIADVLTLTNALCGFLAIVAVAYGLIDIAIRLVFLGMFFDALDGPIARMQKPTSYGKELDRFSDRITQSIAPALILIVINAFNIIAILVASGMIIVSIIRMTRINVEDGRILRGAPINNNALVIICGHILGFDPFLLSVGALILTIFNLSYITYNFSLPAINKPLISEKGNIFKIAFLVRAAYTFSLFVAPAPLIGILSIATISGIIAFNVLNAGPYLISKVKLLL